MWVTVHKHKGIAIKMKSPALPSEFGYKIKHKQFTGQLFDLIQDAIDAIDRLTA